MRTSSAARRFVTWAPLAAVLIALLPTFAVAQEPVKSFDQLNTRLKVGDTVVVTDAQGRKVKGKIRELHDASITLDSNGQTTLQADSVRLVQRSTSVVGKAALWGLAAGAVLGAVAAATDDDCDGSCPPPLLGAGLCGALGAGVGALVGASFPVVVYRAPGPTDAAHARLSIAPVITPRTKGVALSYSF